MSINHGLKNGTRPASQTGNWNLVLAESIIEPAMTRTGLRPFESVEMDWFNVIHKATVMKWKTYIIFTQKRWRRK